MRSMRIANKLEARMQRRLTPDCFKRKSTAKNNIANSTPPLHRLPIPGHQRLDNHTKQGHCISSLDLLLMPLSTRRQICFALALAVFFCQVLFTQFRMRSRTEHPQARAMHHVHFGAHFAKPD